MTFTPRAIEEPTCEQVSSFQVLDNPNWLARTAPNVNLASDGSSRHEIELICGSKWGGGKLKGRLRIQYSLERRSVPKTWWDEITCDTTWAHPHRVYRLAEVVRATHERALRKYQPRSVVLDHEQTTVK